MKPLALLIGALGVGSAAAATTVISLAPPVSQSISIGDWTDERPGPDSARVAMMLDAMVRTDPVACEMLSDQLGNYWFTGGEFGVGQLADTRTAARAAKDSVSGRVRSPGAIALLTARLASDDPCVRRTAARMLGRSTIADGGLALLLEDPGTRVREAALLAIGTHDRPALRARVEQALDDRDPAVAAMAAWSLGALEDRASVDPLVGALGHANLRVRINAAWALGTIEDPRAVRPLLGSLDDSDPMLRATVAEALGDIESTEAAPALERLVGSDRDRRVRLAAIEALGQIELVRSAPALARVLDGSDLELAVAAAEALGDLDDLREAPAQLVRATRSSNPLLRLVAIDALASIEDPNTADALIAVVADANWEIRLMAIEALGDMEVVEATAAITGALTDQHPEVRRAAVEALADIEDR
jgi:HEAT repeat protein